MTPKAVLFDAGNTLIWLDHPFIVEVLREHGVETTTERECESGPRDKGPWSAGDAARGAGQTAGRDRQQPRRKYPLATR